jgi:hypothetical protein
MIHLFQSYVAVSVFSCCNCFIWMLQIFHTHVASICPKYFICFKCMLYSSVSCCKCRPLVLVSMRTGRAKPQPPTRGGGAGHRRRCGEEAQATWCCCGRGGGKSSVRPRRDGRHAGVEESGTSHSSNVGSRSEAGSSDTSELAQATRESEWMGWSSRGRLDVQALVLPVLECKLSKEQH